MFTEFPEILTCPTVSSSPPALMWRSQTELANESRTPAGSACVDVRQTDTAQVVPRSLQLSAISDAKNLGK